MAKPAAARLEVTGHAAASVQDRHRRPPNVCTWAEGAAWQDAQAFIAAVNLRLKPAAQKGGTFQSYGRRISRPRPQAEEAAYEEFADGDSHLPLH